MPDKRILLLASFHYDVAYRDTFEGYLPRSFEAIDRSLDLLDAHPDYVFNIEQIILLAEYWTRRPAQRDRLRRHAADRRLIFCPGMWTMPDGNVPSAESCYRNALLGRAWLQEHLGAAPGPICWMADIFGHHPQSPQIYRQLGYSLYMFERGQPEDEPATDYWWEGIDGSRLLTHWEADTYYGLNLGLAWLGNRPDEWIADRIRHEVLAVLGSPVDGTTFSKIGGDFLVPAEKHLEFIARWNRGAWGPPVAFAHPDAYIAAVAQAPGLPVSKTERNPLLQGTYSSRIRIKQANRSLENQAFALEALGVARDTTVDTDPLWCGLAKLQFHDILCGTLGDAAWKESMAEAEALERETAARGTALLRGDGGTSEVVFNPLPYARSEVVDTAAGPLPVRIGPLGLAEVSAVTAPVVHPAAAAAANRVLTNALIRIEFDEFGRVQCLRDLETGRVFRDEQHGFVHDIMMESDFGDLWVLHEGPVNGSLLHTAPERDPVRTSGSVVTRRGMRDRRGADSPCFAPPAIEAETAPGGVRASVTVAHGGLVTRYTLNAGEKILRVSVRHRLKGIQRRLRAVIPTGIPNGTIRREVPAGWIAQPEGEYPAQNWLDYADHDRGLCLLNRGLPGNNVTDGVMLLTLFRAVAMLEPNVLPDFELDVEQTADYALVPFLAGDPAHNPARLGHCFNQPLLTATAAAAPTGGYGLEVLSPAAEALAIRRLADGAIEFRLHESAGRADTTDVRSSQPLGEVVLVTPLGQALATVPLADGDPCRFSLALKPFEIVTLRIQRRGDQPTRSRRRR